MKTSLIQWLRRWAVVVWFSLLLTVVHAAPKSPEILVELNSFIAHCDTDDWGRTTGISCVVTNQSQRVVTVQEGYDGVDNLLTAPVHQRFTIGLRPWGEKRVIRELKLAPGESKTIFTLPFHDILLLGGEANRELWRWNWAYTIPRGMPPVSPAHSQYQIGWPALVADEVEFTADVLVDGQRLHSKPLRHRVNKPKPNGAKALEVCVATADGVVIPGGDILAYHWPSHSLKLREGVLQKLLKKYGKRLEEGVPFHVRVGGVNAYEGLLITPDIRKIFQIPVMLVADLSATAIEYGYHLEAPPKAPDPRCDARIRQELLSAGILLQ